MLFMRYGYRSLHFRSGSIEKIPAFGETSSHDRENEECGMWEWKENGKVVCINGHLHLRGRF